MTTGLITISQYVTNPPVQLSSDDVLEIRGFYTRNFIGGDGVTPIEGNFTNGQFGPYYSITPTLNGSGNLVVPAHEIQATTLSNPTGNYIEQLWVNGALSVVLMPNTQGATGWQIPTVYGDEISFDEIATYNRAKRLLYPPQTYFTADETIEEIRRLSGDRAYASSTIVGITALSKDPDVPSFPEARGVNDPQWAQASVDDPSAAGDGFFDPDEGEFFGSSLANVPSQFLRANSAINAANVEGLVFNLATYGGVCDGVTPDDTALALALGAIGSTQAILVLPYTVEGQCLLALDATIPANVTIDFDASGTGFLLTNSRTLTIVGPMISVPHQVFFNARSGQGTVSFAGNEAVTKAHPAWWGWGTSTAAVNSASWNACNAALVTIGSGEIELADGTYDINATCSVGSDAGFTGISVGGTNGLVGTVLNWTGATNTVAIYVNKGRFNHVHDFYLINAGVLGTSIGISLAGPGTSLQTAHSHCERVTVDGFAKGIESGHTATNSASDEGLFTLVAFQKCGKGFSAESNFNSVSLGFDRCTFALNEYGLYCTTANGVALYGSGGGSNTVSDIYFSGGGAQISITGWDSESSSGEFLHLANAAQAVLNGIDLRGYTMVRADDTGLINCQGSTLSIDTMFHGGSFTGLGPHLINLQQSPSYLTLKNIYTPTDFPFFIHPSNTGGIGSTYSIENCWKINNISNAVEQFFPYERGIVTAAMSGVGIKLSQELLLGSISQVNMNTATATTLFTVPTGRSVVITRVVVRNADTSLTTASYSFGFNSASFNDVIANATHVELTGGTLYTTLFAKVGAKVGTSAQTFSVLMNTLQGGAALTTMDVYGYYTL